MWRGPPSWCRVFQRSSYQTSRRDPFAVNVWRARGSVCSFLPLPQLPIAQADAPDGAKGVKNAYFSRPFCLQELRWARQNNVLIQPVVM